MIVPSEPDADAFWSARHSASWSTESIPRSSAMRPIRKSLCVVTFQQYIGRLLPKTVELAGVKLLQSRTVRGAAITGGGL
jgi:hypothetical protein